MPDDYIFDEAGREHEQARLLDQSEVIAPLTRRALIAAGLTEGMSVLELGSGGGDVSLLLAELVGPRGRVLGVELNPQAVLAARTRVQEIGLEGVEFVEADIRTLALDRQFDAVVGRLVLTFMKDPAQVLRTAAAHVRHGGIVFMQEGDAGSPFAAPDTPLFVQCRELLVRAMEHGGSTLRMGERLYTTFIEAGLAPPQLRCERVMGGVELGLHNVIANLVTGVVPSLKSAGLIRPDAIDLESLPSQLGEELLESQGVAMTSPLTSAWSSRSRG